MFATLIPLLVSTVVSTSAGIALDSIAKLLTPPNVRAITGFGIKAGSVILGAIVSTKLADYAAKNTQEIIDVVHPTVLEENKSKYEDELFDPSKKITKTKTEDPT